MIALLAGLLALLLLIFVLTGRNRTDQDRLGDGQIANADTAAVDPEKRCASQKTYDLIKRELFRRAAQVRGSDQAAFGQLAAYSVVRMDAPTMTGRDENLGIVRCSGSLALDLPPGVAVVGGRRTLTADIDYSIQPAADRSGNVLTLSKADAIITPLATLARIGASTGESLTPVDPELPADNLAPLPGSPATSDPPAVTTPPSDTDANPSFNCGNASTRGEIAVCGDAGLAALDRRMAAQFNNAMSRADAEERALLEQTRNRFLRYRDNCRSDACIADAYRGRMTEIGDIMAGRWRPLR